MSQKAHVLFALQAGKQVSPLDALRLWGCLRLAARICELREAGYRIESHERNGYSVYTMVRKSPKGPCA